MCASTLLFAFILIWGLGLYTFWIQFWYPYLSFLLVVIKLELHHFFRSNSSCSWTVIWKLAFKDVWGAEERATLWKFWKLDLSVIIEIPFPSSSIIKNLDSWERSTLIEMCRRFLKILKRFFRPKKVDIVSSGKLSIGNYVLPILIQFK